jgi:hypothetical protein
MLVAITQVPHKKQTKQPRVSQDTITITKNRNTKCSLLNKKYSINAYSELCQVP